MKVAAERRKLLAERRVKINAFIDKKSDDIANV
ncbi:hypothetical protein SAMN05421863_11553 [Nitrosomonas communis]|uniref:Uncharacterized protein n=1 Tax=Nitrosomonas communis TaxID=44574 RepID=A0A1I4XHB9_9PROT|nr:hypothetical protein SAMN05421863_11553 [Nitrosomonas communis]